MRNTWEKVIDIGVKKFIGIHRIVIEDMTFDFVALDL